MVEATATGYAWVLIKAFSGCDEDEKLVGLTGPSDHSFEPLEVAEHGVEFRLFDDDGELCFEGRIMGTYDGFEPLDDWGCAGYGCTEIKYKDYYHQWKPL